MSPLVSQKWRLRAPVLALTAMLAGCATPPPKPAPPPPPPPTSITETRPPPVKPIVRPPPPGVQRPPVTQEPLPPPATAPAPEPAQATPAAPQPGAEPVPATVIGLSQTDVRALLGDPAATGAAGPAQTWTYRADACSLTVAFFYDVTRSAFFALSAHAEPLSEPECLAHLHGEPHAS
jgi:hypothetical protein